MRSRKPLILRPLQLQQSFSQLESLNCKQLRTKNLNKLRARRAKAPARAYLLVEKKGRSLFSVFGSHGMDHRSDNRKPEYLQSADLIADEMNMTGRELLDLIRKTALSPNYPTEECFLPQEVWEYEHTGLMPDGRLAHRDSCVNCHALLVALQPDGALTREFTAAVAQCRASGDGPSSRRREEEAVACVAAAPNFEPHARAWRKKAVAFVAVAAVLCFGFLSFTYSKWALRKPTNSEGFADQQEPRELVVTNEISKRQIRVTVKALDSGRISSSSYPAAAAATALVSEPLLLRMTGDRTNIPDAAHEDTELANKIVLALSSACGKEEHTLFPSKDRESLEQALKDQQIVVWQVSPSSDNFVVKYGGHSATLEPTKALSSTLRYCRLLDRTAGDTHALDSSAKNVQIRVASVQ